MSNVQLANETPLGAEDVERHQEKPRKAIICTSWEDLTTATAFNRRRSVEKILSDQCAQACSIHLTGFLNLTALECKKCANLQAIMNFAESPTLQRLALLECHNITSIDLQGTKALTEVHLNCLELRSIRGLECLTALQKLDLRGCKQITSIELSSCMLLTHLYCDASMMSSEMHGLAELHALQLLDLSGNEAIKQLDITTLQSITELSCANCTSLHTVTGLNGHQQLTTLRVSRCVHLAHLQFHSCPKLRDVVGIPDLTKLQKFIAYETPQLTALDVTGCVKLTDLRYQNCSPHLHVVGIETLPKTGRQSHRQPKDLPLLERREVRQELTLLHLYMIRKCQHPE